MSSSATQATEFIKRENSSAGSRRCLEPAEAAGLAWDSTKFWLEPVALADNRGFRGHELTDINRLVVEHRQLFLEKWHEYFGRTS